MDGLRVRIRKHRVLDLVPVSKISQDFFRVIADGCQLDALLFESRDCTLQLDQLPFTEGSPVRGTEKEKNSAVPAFQGFKSLYPSKLVANRKSRGFLANRESNRHSLYRSHLNRIAVERPAGGHCVSQRKDYLVLRLKVVHDPVRIVIERQLRTRHDFVALGRLEKGLVCVAAARHKDAGPRSGISRVVLPSHGEGD